MQDRFESYGIRLPEESIVSFDFGKKQILSSERNTATIHAEIIQVEERYEQIAAAFLKIEELVQSGIAAESIALILPDESLKESFALYDARHNLNFAMGFDYRKSDNYKKLDALYGYWQNHDHESRKLVERYGLALEEIDRVSPSQKCDCRDFFMMLDQWSLLDTPLELEEGKGPEEGSVGEALFEAKLHLSRVFGEKHFSRKEWLFLWLKSVSKISIDDVRGGRITVMGVLETRGMQFDAVVIVDFNEGIVPTPSSKDQFLNSSVRSFAGLPTREDRESLQKQYYRRLMEQAKRTVILYCSSENRLPSKFLYELALGESRRLSPPSALLYDMPSQLRELKDPVVEYFDAGAVTWSASRLKTWLECKRKYYYRYEQKIEAKEVDELNEGAFLHLLLDHLFSEKDHYESAEEMQKAIDVLMEKLLPRDDAGIAYRKLLWREKLKGFTEKQIRHFEAGWRVAACEYEAAGEIGGLRFKGRIDRIDCSDMQTLVIDYKSGSIKEANRSQNLEKLNDFQMSIYDALLAEKYPNITLVFVQVLEGGRVEEITVLEEKNRLLEEHIAQLKQTDHYVAQRCETLQQCNYCEFALMCERGEYL